VVLPLLRRHHHHRPHQHHNVRRLRLRHQAPPFCLSPPSESIVGIDFALDCSSCKRYPTPRDPSRRIQWVSRYFWNRSSSVSTLA
jgi:hypothetical protein